MDAVSSNDTLISTIISKKLNRVRLVEKFFIEIQDFNYTEMFGHDEIVVRDSTPSKNIFVEPEKCDNLFRNKK